MMTMQSGARRCRRSCDSGARILSGWWTGIFAARAAFFTGEEESSRPRPRGRSGWVMTPTILKSGCARRFFRVGIANCGVPQNTMRMAHPLRRLPLALFSELLDFALDEVALEHAEMLNEENSIQVIDLVAESARQEIFTANFKLLALRILRAHRDELRANDVAAEAGNREAAFLFADFAFGVDDLRIRENDFGFGILAAGDVDDGETQAQADLRRGQADTLRGVHGSEHIFGEFFDLGVEFGYGRGGPLQDRIAILDDGIDFARWSGCFGRSAACG